MKAHTGYKHWPNQFGGYNAECTFCPGRKLFADATEADEWWAIHQASVAHVNASTKGRKSK